MRYALSMDIGGTNIKYAIVDENGYIFFESLKSIKPEDNDSALLAHIKHMIAECFEIARVNEIEIVGIGIGVPSVVDSGVVLFANNLPELDNQQLDVIISDHFGVPVFVENDANLMGLGEVRYGAARNVSDAVFITIGTGIGGALILNGKLYGGYKNRGTELGHIVIDWNGKACTCGGKGCFEAYASMTALIQEYKNLLPENSLPGTEKVDGKYIVSKFLENEEIAAVAMNNHFQYMAAGITGFINVFAPQKVIIGGGISEAGDFYLKSIAILVDKMVMKETSQFTTIELASLGNKAGFLGAAALVFNQTL